MKFYNLFFKTNRPDYSQEATLINGCKENDRIAQEVLYKKYFDLVYQSCSKFTHNEEDTLSLVNEGFLKVFLNIEKYEAIGSFEGWIRRIVYHNNIDFVRKQNSQTKVIPIDQIAHQGIEDNETLGIEDLDKMIEKLPETTRKVFIKCAVEGYSHEETAKSLNIAVGTSKWHLSQARDMLKSLILKEEIRFENAKTK